jgi:hypothetical protein
MALSKAQTEAALVVAQAEVSRLKAENARLTAYAKSLSDSLASAPKPLAGLPRIMLRDDDGSILAALTLAQTGSGGPIEVPVAGSVEIQIIAGQKP